jgi:hypothetical protein
MVYYEKVRCYLITAYLFAVLIKVYNVWYYFNLKMHIKAKQQEVPVSDVIKLSYYKFFTRNLRNSESAQTFYNFGRQFRKSEGFCHE